MRVAQVSWKTTGCLFTVRGNLRAEKVNCSAGLLFMLGALTRYSVSSNCLSGIILVYINRYLNILSYIL